MVLGIAILAVAVFLRGPSAQEGAPATITAAPEREYIEPTDSDGDGILDWEEGLQGKVFDTISTPTELSTGDGSEFKNATTVTDIFAREFFEGFIKAKIPGAPQQNQEEFISSAITSAERQTRDVLFTRSDIIVSTETDFDAIRRYGNRIAEIANSYPVPAINEAAILQHALDTDDPTFLENLSPIEDAYQGMVKETLSLPVPSTVIKQHLNLLNTYKMILTDVEAMQLAFIDPLYTLVRMKRYEDDARGMLFAFQAIDAVLQSNGITYTENEPGIFYSALRPI